MTVIRISLFSSFVAMSLLSACAQGAVGGAVVGDALFDAPVAGAVVGTAIANNNRQCTFTYADGTQRKGDCPPGY